MEGIMIMYCDKCEMMIGVETLDIHTKICVPFALEKASRLSSLEDNRVPQKLVQNLAKSENIDIDKNIVIAKIPKTKQSTANKQLKHQNKTISLPSMNNNLLPHQIKAVNWCTLKAKIYHKNVYPNTVIRFLELGYNEEDVINCLDYIKNIDVIAHFGRETSVPIQWLKTETKLKNAFETNPPHTGYLSARKDWEDNLFNKIYSSECDITTRVKYGCLNLLSDPTGCPSAKGYGSSYMIFKNNIKSRTTFVCGDSSSKQTHICTFDNCVQLLLYMDELTLKNVIQLAKMKKTKQYNKIILHGLQHQRSYMYIEVQIHGDVVLNKDVSHIMLYHKNYDDEILARLDRLGVPYTVFDDNDTKIYKPLFIL
jgi:hypothetical protein